MKLPKELGGLNVPDIQLYYEVLRMSWIKSLYNSHNRSDWKPLAIMAIDTLTENPGIGKDILSYPKKFPKKSTPHFWTTNIRACKTSLN